MSKAHLPETSGPARRRAPLSRWNPLLPLVVSLLGCLTFAFASSPGNALTTFGICFAVAYASQVLFGRFFVALPFLTTVSSEAPGETARLPRKSAGTAVD